MFKKRKNKYLKCVNLQSLPVTFSDRCFIVQAAHFLFSDMTLQTICRCPNPFVLQI